MARPTALASFPSIATGGPSSASGSIFSRSSLQFVVGLLLGHWCLGARKLVRVDEPARRSRRLPVRSSPLTVRSGARGSSPATSSIQCRRFPLVPSTTLMIRLREAGIGRVFLFDVHDDQMHPTLGDEDPLTPRDRRCRGERVPVRPHRETGHPRGTAARRSLSRRRRPVERRLAHAGTARGRQIPPGEEGVPLPVLVQFHEGAETHRSTRRRFDHHERAANSRRTPAHPAAPPGTREAVEASVGSGTGRRSAGPPSRSTRRPPLRGAGRSSTPRARAKMTAVVAVIPCAPPPSSRSVPARSRPSPRAGPA